MANTVAKCYRSYYIQISDEGGATQEEMPPRPPNLSCHLQPAVSKRPASDLLNPQSLWRKTGRAKTIAPKFNNVALQYAV